jgi:hypothetical protein
MTDGVGAGRGGNRHGYWLMKVGGFLCYLALEKDEFDVKRVDSG